MLDSCCNVRMVAENPKTRNHRTLNSIHDTLVYVMHFAICTPEKADEIVVFKGLSLLLFLVHGEPVRWQQHGHQLPSSMRV